MTDLPIHWTAREALACAYCWVEFTAPEDRTDTPETYWLKISERARNECRQIAKERLLLATARGEAVALLPPSSAPADLVDHLCDACGLKARHRMRKILDAVYLTFKVRRGA